MGHIVHPALTPVGPAAADVRPWTSDWVRWGSVAPAPPTAASQLEALVANVPGAIYRCRLDADWSMEYLSDEIERMTGFPASDFLPRGCRSFASVIHPDDRDHVAAVVAEAVATNRAFAPEYRVVRADGSVIWVLERGRVSEPSTDVDKWLDGAIFEITDRKILEQELRRSLAEEAAADERLRLARDLHDAVGHALSIGVIHIGAARAAANDDAEALGRALDTIESSLRDALREMRTMVHALHHELTDTSDHHLRLDDLIGIARRSGLEVELLVVGQERSLPAAVDVSLYRTVQESLTNCLRYAAGAHVTIELTNTASAIELTVTDNGAGTLERATVTQSNGWGLHGIRERARALGGSFSAGELPQGGFHVAVTYPT